MGTEKRFTKVKRHQRSNPKNPGLHWVKKHPRFIGYRDLGEVKLLQPTHISDIRGVGGKTAKILAEHGLTTIEDAENLAKNPEMQEKLLQSGVRPHVLAQIVKVEESPRYIIKWQGTKTGLTWHGEIVEDIQIFNMNEEKEIEFSGRQGMTGRDFTTKRRWTKDQKEIYLYVVTTAKGTVYVAYAIQNDLTHPSGFVGKDDHYKEFGSQKEAERYLKKFSKIPIKDMGRTPIVLGKDTTSIPGHFPLDFDFSLAKPKKKRKPKKTPPPVKKVEPYVPPGGKVIRKGGIVFVLSKPQHQQGMSGKRVHVYSFYEDEPGTIEHQRPASIFWVSSKESVQKDELNRHVDSLLAQKEIMKRREERKRNG